MLALKQIKHGTGTNTVPVPLLLSCSTTALVARAP